MGKDTESAFSTTKTLQNVETIWRGGKTTAKVTITLTDYLPSIAQSDLPLTKDVQESTVITIPAGVYYMHKWQPTQHMRVPNIKLEITADDGLRLEAINLPYSSH